MIITYILSAFTVVILYLISLAVPFANRLSENVTYAFWACTAICLTVLLMRPAYSIWLSLDFWIDPWQPDSEPLGHDDIR